MIRDPEMNNLVISVKLKSGKLYEYKDISSKPMGDYERTVSFWHNGKIRAYPLQDIEYYEIIPHDK
jgi:hypothetical protein